MTKWGAKNHDKFLSTFWFNLEKENVDFGRSFALESSFFIPEIVTCSM